MKRSERMAALKAERKAKMEQRRARMAAKKAGSNKRAYDNPEIQEKAERVFRDAFKEGGGDYARRQRRKFLKDAQFKMDTEPKEVMDNELSRPPRGERKISGIPYKVMDPTDPDTIDDLREGRTSGSDYYKKGGKVKKGRSVKKGYKSGGKVRGAGCVTKGVRPCKMR